MADLRHPAERSLCHLECCRPRNEAWRQYIRQRAGEVQNWIQQLVAFANLNDKSLCHQPVMERASKLQERLDAVLRMEER